MKVRIVTATRADPDQFASTHIGRTIATFERPLGLRTSIFFENSRGLSACYNEAIDAAQPDEILVFAHDDAMITDLFWTRRVAPATAAFDLVGIAGNKRRFPRQSSWAFVDENLTFDDKSNLSGVVANGDGFPCTISVFGPVPQRCLLLDGVVMIAKRATFDHIRFDERFDFHFYDMDICRQAEAAGLTMGTAQIGVIHKSIGEYYTPAWHRGYARYLEKWGD